MGDIFSSIKDRFSRIAGAALLGGAVLLLMFMPEEFNPLLFYGYVVCWGLGFLLVAGYIGTNPVVSRLRRGASEPVRRVHRHPADVVQRVFRYPTSPLRYAIVLVMSVSCLGGAIALCWIVPSVDTIAAVLPLFFTGGLGLLYAYRYSHIGIRVDEWGLEARTWLGNVCIKWDEIIALIRHDLPPTPARFRAYKIYARHKKLVFYDTLVGHAELAALVSRRTGLDWIPPN